MAVDGRHLGGRRAIDGDDDDPARFGAVGACIYGDILGIARSRLHGGVAEAGMDAVKIAEGAEAREDVGLVAVQGPEVCREKSLGAEDAEVVGLSDGAGDVLAASIIVFGNGKSHARIFCGDARLQAAQDVDGAAECAGDPGTLRIGRVPQTARALHDGLNLRVGERGARQSGDAMAAAVSGLGVPVKVVYIDQRLAVRR